MGSQPGSSSSATLKVPSDSARKAIILSGKQFTHGLAGLAIGSVFIDRAVHQLICEKLEQLRQHLQLTPREVAWKMISGRFQRLKCAFGSEANLTPWLKLDVPSLESDADFPEANIYNGQMQIAW